MSNKTYEATVINGQIQLPADVKLPENARVLVTVPDEAGPSNARVRTPRLVNPEQVKDFQMEVEGARDAGI